MISVLGPQMTKWSHADFPYLQLLLKNLDKKKLKSWLKIFLNLDFCRTAY